MRTTEQTRKPYAKPRVREYGDLRRLTEQLTGTTGNPDGAMYGSQNLKTGG